MVDEDEVCLLFTAGDRKSMSELMFFTKWYLRKICLINQVLAYKNFCVSLVLETCTFVCHNMQFLLQAIKAPLWRYFKTQTSLKISGSTLNVADV